MLKYRVWDNTNKRFSSVSHYLDEEGNLYTDLDPHGVDMSGKRSIGIRKQYSFAGYSTGIKDKNKVDIYQYDEVKFLYEGLFEEKEVMGTVELEGLTWYVTFPYFGISIELDKLNKDLIERGEEFEIVGNTYKSL